MKYEGNFKATVNAELALITIEDAIKFLENEKNCSSVRDMLTKVRDDLDCEIRVRKIKSYYPVAD